MELNGVTALANAVRQARREARLSQQELADRSGMSRVSVARLETGTANTTLDSLLRVASVLGMRLEASWDAAGAAPDPLPRKRPRTQSVKRPTKTSAAVKKNVRTAEATAERIPSRVGKSRTKNNFDAPVDLHTVLARVARP